MIVAVLINGIETMIKYIFVLSNEKENPMMETLNYYQMKMASAVPDPVILDLSDKSSYLDSIQSFDNDIGGETTVIIFNSRGFTTSFDGSTLYWVQKNVRLVNILVDHPFYYTDMLLMAPPNMKLGLVDRHFVNLLSDWLPAIGKNAFFFPHGGTDLGLSGTSYEDRPIDVLYTGSRYPNDVFCPPLDFLPDNGDSFYEFAKNKYFEDEYIEEDGIVDSYLSSSGIVPSVSQKIMMTVCLLKSVKFQVMHEMKTNLIKALASSGIHITIHGRGWEDLRDMYPECITIGSYLNSEECIRRMCNARITLNMMPFFRDGAHERVFNAMLSGSVLVSNKSRYLEENFSEGGDIIFTEKDPCLTAQKVKDVLSDPEKWRFIRENAYSKAKNCTWEDRMRDLIL